MNVTRIMKVVAVAALALTIGVADDAKKNTGKSSKKSEKAAPKKAAAKAGDAAEGESVYKSNCAVCHYADKTDKRIGPGLAGFFKREKMENGKPVNEANTRELIMEGYGKMIPFKEKLDEKQLDDVIAYLKTL